MRPWPWLAILPLAACTAMPAQEAKPSGYAGKVQKVFRVVRESAVLPGRGILGEIGSLLAPLRQHGETHQYVVRTPRGQIIAQSDDEFPVGECVQVIPQTDRSGPAFRYGEATIVRCN